MKVKIKGGPVLNYTGLNARNDTIDLSGDKSGVGPMEAVLMAGAACSAIDIELILNKMRQPLEGIEADADAERAETDPKVFLKIHVHYRLKGKLKEEKVKEAIDKSVTKYCSVLTMLAKTASITTSYEINE
jgi:putative redox protein